MKLNNSEVGIIQSKTVGIFDELIKSITDENISEEKLSSKYDELVEKVVYLVEEIVDNHKSNIFVQHIEAHLEQMGLSEENVVCKICDKTIDEIYTTCIQCGALVNKDKDYCVREGWICSFCMEK